MQLLYEFIQLYINYKLLHMINRNKKIKGYEFQQYSIKQINNLPHTL